MKHNIAKSALWVTFSEIFFNLSGFIIHSVLGRFLGPEDYGRYGLVITLTTMVIILIGNGIPTAMAKYISEYFETDAGMVKVIKRQAIILQSIIIGTITIIFYFSAPLIARILGDDSLTPLFRISTLIIPSFAAASFYFSYYTGLHRFNLQATLKTLRSIFKIVFIIGLALLFQVKGSIMGYIVGPALIFLIAFLFDKFKVSKELEAQSANQIKKGSPSFEWKKLVNYAWQVVLFFLAYELLISIDLYLVQGVLQNNHLTGIYNGALTVGRIPYYIFYALTIFMLPMISKSTSQNNHPETARIISNSIRLMLILLVPMIILMAIFAKPIISLFYGAGYGEAVYPMSILVYGVGFLTIFYVLSFAMNGAGKTKIPMYISILGVILNTVLNYILIKQFALTGSAIATSITSFIIMLAMLFYIRRDFGVTLKIRTVLRVALAGFHIYIFSLIITLGDKFFIIESSILLLIYFGFLWILREIKKEDIAYLKGMSRNKKVAEVEVELSGNEPSA